MSERSPLSESLFELETEWQADIENERQLKLKMTWFPQTENDNRQATCRRSRGNKKRKENPVLDRKTGEGI